MAKKQNYLLRMVLLGILLVFISYIFRKAGPLIIATVSNPVKLKYWLKFSGSLSMLFFIILQTITLVMTPIPSEALLLTGGYLFGTIPGAVCSLGGIFLGTIIAFWVARYFGLPLVKKLVPQRLWDKFGNVLQNPLFEPILLIVFLIPGFPKDALTYIVGLTTTKTSKSLIMILIARMPGILISSYIGANLRRQNFLPLIIGLVIVSIVLGAGFLFQAKFAALIQHKYLPDQKSYPKCLPEPKA